MPFCMRKHSVCIRKACNSCRVHEWVIVKVARLCWLFVNAFFYCLARTILVRTRCGPKMMSYWKGYKRSLFLLFDIRNRILHFSHICLSFIWLHKKMVEKPQDAQKSLGIAYIKLFRYTTWFMLVLISPGFKEKISKLTAVMKSARMMLKGNMWWRLKHWRWYIISPNVTEVKMVPNPIPVL